MKKIDPNKITDFHRELLRRLEAVCELYAVETHVSTKLDNLRVRIQGLKDQAVVDVIEWAFPEILSEVPDA